MRRHALPTGPTARPYLLFEAPLAVRYYLPREDVVDGLLRSSPTRTACAYKGQASYWSLEDEEDNAWSYPKPLRKAAEVTDRIAFFNERVDLVVNGTRLAGQPVVTALTGATRARRKQQQAA